MTKHTNIDIYVNLSRYTWFNIRGILYNSKIINIFYRQRSELNLHVECVQVLKKEKRLFVYPRF